MDKCSITGCAHDAKKRGMCGMHYLRWWRNGDATITKRAASGAGFDQSGYRAHRIDGKVVLDHTAIAEMALGHKLPDGAEVHHVDENRTNNTPSNLVICPDHSYHALLHLRAKALAATGDPLKRKCAICKTYDDVDKLKFYGKNAPRHLNCMTEYNRSNYANRNGY